MSVVGLLLVDELVEVMACPSIGDVVDTTTARAISSEVMERFLAGYRTTRTRDNYRSILARWLDWCHERRYDRSRNALNRHATYVIATTSLAELDNPVGTRFCGLRGLYGRRSPRKAGSADWRVVRVARR